VHNLGTPGEERKGFTCESIFDNLELREGKILGVSRRRLFICVRVRSNTRSSGEVAKLCHLV
jgi:hypothetical protein